MKPIDWCIDSGKCDDVTHKQLTVLRFLMDGLTNEDIGLEMHLSEKTIKAHITAILKRYGQPSRAALIVLFTSLYINHLEQSIKMLAGRETQPNGVVHGSAQSG